MKRFVSVISLLAFLVSCGHLANPAPPKAELTSGRDRNASCADINAEILHLQGERSKAESKLSTQTGQNIAAVVGGILLLFPVVFLDVTTDKSEAYQSYVYREEYLRKLAQDKNCTDLPRPYQGPFNQQPNTAFVPSGGNVVQAHAGSAGAVPIQPKAVAEPKAAVAGPKAVAGRSSLLQSAKTGDIAGIKAALADGAWINQKDDAGDTALMIATYSGNTDAVEYLCRNGADVNDRNPQNATALIYAAYYNQVNAAKVLLGYSADRTVRDKYKNTALDYAQKYGYGGVASLLKPEGGGTGTAATGSGVGPAGSESAPAAVARVPLQNEPASVGAALSNTTRKQTPIHFAGPPTPLGSLAPLPVPPLPRLLTSAEIRDLLLRSAGWEGTWHAPGGRIVTGDFLFRSQGDNLLAKISIVDRPYIDRACEKEVRMTSEVVTFENCVNTEITLRYDPADSMYPFKGKGSNGSDYKFREK